MRISSAMSAVLYNIYAESPLPQPDEITCHVG